jgi:hypothetical protein
MLIFGVRVSTYEEFVLFLYQREGVRGRPLATRWTASRTEVSILADRATAAQRSSTVPPCARNPC